MKEYGVETVNDFLNHWIDHTGELIILDDDYYDDVFDALDDCGVIKQFLECNEQYIGINTDHIGYTLKYILNSDIANAKVRHFAISWEEKIVCVFIKLNGDDN